MILSNINLFFRVSENIGGNKMLSCDNDMRQMPNEMAKSKTQTKQSNG